MSAPAVATCEYCQQPSPWHRNTCFHFRPCGRFKGINGPWGIKPAGLPSDRCANCNGTRTQHSNRRKLTEASS